MRRLFTIVAVATVCLAPAGSATADGGPGPGVLQGFGGIASGDERFVAIPSVGWTSVQAIKKDGGRVDRWTNIKGIWGIPVVAYDGTSEALYQGGRTLLLATPAYGPSRTSFAFVETKRLRVVRKVSLHGRFAFDALSPDLRYLYLIEYVSDADFSQYRVRAYDLRANKLLPKIVSDRRSWETTMRGQPITRLSRAGWAYTLYGGIARPFIHALDTRRAEAVCIFMPWKSSPKRLYEYRLRSDGDEHLVVRGRHGRALVTVDLASFRVESFVPNP